MWKRLSLLVPALVAGLVILAFTPLGTWAQTFTSLNYFYPCAGGAALCDNALNIDGTLEFEDKATVIDHGTASVGATGYTSVTTNLSSTVSCLLTLKTAAPADDPVMVTGLWTTGGAILEIFAWKTTGSDPTLLASATATSVGWVCFGSD